MHLLCALAWIISFNLNINFVMTMKLLSPLYNWWNRAERILCLETTINGWQIPEPAHSEYWPQGLNVSTLQSLGQDTTPCPEVFPNGEKDPARCEVKARLCFQGSKYKCCEHLQKADFLFLDHKVLLGEANPAHCQHWCWGVTKPPLLPIWN